jgi:hypothetical protein
MAPLKNNAAKTRNVSSKKQILVKEEAHSVSSEDIVRNVMI